VALAGYVRQFVARLEHHARAAPDNWFNFFDFWYESPRGAGPVSELDNAEQPAQ
jgi:predicted LPLAT superfamily acyltransferase